ncbi:MAG: hypothetical protein ABJB65_05810 [Chloroflexota bacterium]
MFWRRKAEQQEEPEQEPSPGLLVEPVAPRSDLVPIRIVMEDEVLDGWTHAGSQRMSDLLNGEDMLSVSLVEDDPTETDWKAIERERILLVVAPPHASPRQLRVHRQKRKIRAQSAYYAVAGSVHLIPGNSLDMTMLRTRQHFLPITEARVVMPSEPDIEVEHEVVLVNLVDADEDLKMWLDIPD